MTFSLGALLAFELAWVSLSPAEEPPKVDVEVLVKALELLRDRPADIEKLLKEALAQEQARKQSTERELESIQERLKRLESANSILKAIKARESVPPVAEPPVAPPAEPAAAVVPKPEARPLAGEAKERFIARFEKEIWPLFKQGSQSCFSCHGPGTKTPLEFHADARPTFIKLLQEHYFDLEFPSAIVPKITSAAEKSRMPPAPQEPLAADNIEKLKSFSEAILAAQGGRDERADERFPETLLLSGESHASPPVFGDNMFLSYFQLRRKIETIFGETWRRNEKDLFNENIVLFSGADFHVRYNESTSPSAGYLTGLDLLARGVASNAFLNSTGPFRGWKSSLASLPPGGGTADAPTREAIVNLYRAMLYREPTENELADSFKLLQSLYDAGRDGTRGDSRLDFDLVVQGEGGDSTTRNFQIDLRDTDLGLTRELIDQDSTASLGAPRRVLGGPFHFKSGASRQSVLISNRDSLGAVSVAGIEIVGPKPWSEVKSIDYDAPGVKLVGPWKFRSKGNMRWIDDGADNKGQCTIEFPIEVWPDGEYAVVLKWFPGGGKKKLDAASGVTVEVLSHDPARLEPYAVPDVPPPGEAHFTIDETVDSIAFADLKSSFKFETPDHYVEINNKDTRNRVTADAIRFEPVAGGAPVLMDNDRAEGRENWTPFKDFPFPPYNVTGPDTLSDGNKRKGELTLRYKPATLENWNKDGLWRVGIGFPGQESNETKVPIVIKAAASSPIVQVAYPPRVTRTTPMTLSAAGTYDVQHGKLTYKWRQTGGPRVVFADDTAVTTTATLDPKPAEQAAWEGLARALIRHPDFVFTRPASLAHASGEETRRRLLLVKISQDLVGRPPSPGELMLVYRGAPIEEMIDRYLDSQEFLDFYFHRIRLYLESHGTDEEDEPARLWTWIAANDRPFKEILTADYTVDKSMNRADRPDYYGRTGLLTMKGFIKGKPGLPHFNYAAQVAEKFLGYVFEVPPEIVEQREGITAIGTTDPASACYHCHKVLTPLAFQREHWDDEGRFRTHTPQGVPIDASDRGIVASYPFKGDGIEAFATTAANKERFIRTIINTHFAFYFGRSMRWQEDEALLYRDLWDAVQAQQFTIKGLIRAILTSPEYLGAPRAEPSREKLYASP